MDRDSSLNPKTAKPRLIFDGDCNFCKYSIRYWQKLTGDKVEYRPYQDVASQYPHLSTDDFKRAIQYISPEGETARAAEAGFLTLSHAKGQTLWLNLYRRLPGFAWLTECLYAFVASHRTLFHRLCVLGWGSNPEPPVYHLVTWIFLRLFGLVYLAAFYSFATQAQGLVGSNGILPIQSFLNAVYAQFGWRSYWLAPNVFWLNASDMMLQAVCWSGVLVSLLLILNVLPRISLLLLYVLYLSLVYAGQVFMAFQWDMLLLEMAIVAFFLIRFQVTGIWLLRWLTFRFIFLAGLVKVMSGDAAWWDYTALDYHFLTQPLPTPLAWYAYFLPKSTLQFLTAVSLVIELVLPFFIFSPRRLRIVAALGILAMQCGILLTGNYNFFNITTMVLTLSLFDDAALRSLIPKRILPYMQQRMPAGSPYRFSVFLVSSYTLIAVAVSFTQFNLRYIGFATESSAALVNAFAPLQLINTYGPFAVMTKKRNEIVIEGSSDGDTWYEYEFKFKPGDIRRRPRWNIPFQPRLDWQMWFAALGTADNNPWLGGFVQKLLENAPEVTNLIQFNPFPIDPPLYIRAWIYDYRYATRTQYNATGAWWNRELAGVYFPSVRLP